MRQIEFADVKRQVADALREDIGTGDQTAQLIPSSTMAQAQVLCREPAILCGTAWFTQVFTQLHPEITIQWQSQDGEAVRADQVVCQISGPAHAILTGERTALNFLQTLSGTATLTQRYVNAVEGTGVTILDTRKTIPGLRLAQKYAVTCGGATNHRTGLYDGILIKENHILAAGSIAKAVLQAKQIAGDLAVEVEVESIEELRAALQAQADIVLLDNFPITWLQSAVNLTAKAAKLEASGNITLENIRTVAATGVDFISIGALTKHLYAVDLSMQFNQAA